MNVKDNDIGSTNDGEVVHDSSDALLLNHGADGNPALGLERGDGGGTLAGGDLGGFGETGAFDIVLAEHVFLGGDNATNTGRDEVDHIGVAGGLGLDEDGRGLDDGVDGHEAGGLHGLSGLCLGQYVLVTASGMGKKHGEYA